jgi:hypothetical protein
MRSGIILCKSSWLFTIATIQTGMAGRAALVPGLELQVRTARRDVLKSYIGI